LKNSNVRRTVGFDSQDDEKIFGSDLDGSGDCSRKVSEEFELAEKIDISGPEGKGVGVVGGGGLGWLEKYFEGLGGVGGGEGGEGGLVGEAEEI
jgi:hypothetical protein